MAVVSVQQALSGQHAPGSEVTVRGGVRTPRESKARLRCVNVSDGSCFDPIQVVAPSTLGRVLKGTSRVTPEMALRLSKAIGRSAESWLAMQDAHDLWQARQRVDLQRVGQLRLAAV